MATTISTLNSFVQGVGGERVMVKNIVPVGASPETFQPAPQDVATVADAQVLVENGAGLETWLDQLLRDAGSPNLRVVVGADGLPVKERSIRTCGWIRCSRSSTSQKFATRSIAVDPRARRRIPAQCGDLRRATRRA